MAAIDKSRTRNLRELVVLAINTGMRFGEMNDLTWDRVDLLNRTIWLPGRATKNKKGRHVPLNDNALAALNAIPERIDGGRVFTNARMNEDPFKIALKRARIKNFRFHDLRHTFASRLVMAGIDLYRVSQLLGHSNVLMTQRYAHLAPSAGREAVDVLVDRGTKLAVDGAAR
jgi:integrase